jgi:diacylglycerol kinase (ATP)
VVKGESFGRRLGHARNGWALAARRESSFRIHLTAALALLVLLVLTRPSPVWWAVMALTVGLVVVTELVNSALETLIDRVHPRRDPEIGAAKDLASGAVLTASVAALVVAAAFVVSWWRGA